MSDIAAASGLLGDERITLTLLLVLRCRYTLDKGVLEILRLHGSDAYHILRQAIEAAGSADLVRRKLADLRPLRAVSADAVFIGAQAMIQGRYDGTCKIGDHVWIGPQAYFDARNLVLEDYVGWGPGAKVLGSAHTGEPVDAPIITTALVIKPVVVGFGADIGMNASILPGVRIGPHAIVGAGAVVTQDVPEYAVVAGVPAKVLRSRCET